MSDTARPVTIAVWRSDRTQPLLDGRVPVAGYAPRFIDAPLEEIFSRAFEHGEFDVSELSFSNFLRLTVAGTCPYVGIPVFPSRSFRHGAFYVRSDGSITEPSQLVGGRVGVREYSMTAALAARGALRDGFDIDTTRIHWVVGDIDEIERQAIPLPRLYKHVAIEALASGDLLIDRLLGGDIDAILAYKPPAELSAPQPRLRRLFADYVDAEKLYYRKTGVFPVMHLMGLRKDHAETDPALGRAVYDAFAHSQALALDDLRYEQALKISLPWVGAAMAETTALMGRDFWPAGLGANRKVLERMIAWSLADGLIPQAPDPASLFLPSLHTT